jgi:hypothetical protein
MRNYRHWSGSEIEFLKQNYSKLSVLQIANALHRPKISVRKMSERLGLFKTGHQHLYYSRENMLDEISPRKFPIYSTYCLLNMETGFIYEVGDVRPTLEDTADYIWAYGTGVRKPDSRYVYDVKSAAVFLSVSTLPKLKLLFNSKQKTLNYLKTDYKDALQMIKLRKEGRTLREIGRVFGVDFQTVRNIYRRYLKLKKYKKI